MHSFDLKVKVKVIFPTFNLIRSAERNFKKKERENVPSDLRLFRNFNVSAGPKEANDDVDVDGVTGVIVVTEEALSDVPEVTEVAGPLVHFASCAEGLRTFRWERHIIRVRISLVFKK